MEPLKTRIDQDIINSDLAICENIALLGKTSRASVARNVIPHIRHLIEALAYKIYSPESQVSKNQQNTRMVLSYIKNQPAFKELYSLHLTFNSRFSHVSLGPEVAERLILNYIETLLEIKQIAWLKVKLDILSNLTDFPLNMDDNLKDYYRKIYKTLDLTTSQHLRSFSKNYYIESKKTIYIDGRIFYQLTCYPAINSPSKFDKIIAFSKVNIPNNYATLLNLVIRKVEVYDSQVPIYVIRRSQVNIRSFEIANYANILGVSSKDRGDMSQLMHYLTRSSLNLLDIVNLPDHKYQNLKNTLNQSNLILEILDKSRDIVQKRKDGSNVLRYLLFTMRNTVIKKQLNSSNSPCQRLSNLILEYGCIPFDKMPFATSLIGHNPKLADLRKCIDIEERDHEFLARKIKSNCEIDGEIYTSEKSFDEVENLDKMVAVYNSKIYYKHREERQIVKKSDYYFINGYETNAIEILKQLQEFTRKGMVGYTNSIELFLKNQPNLSSWEEQKAVLIKGFEQSNVIFVRGAAGTGKTTLLEYFVKRFINNKIVLLASTHTALSNLTKKISSAADSMTIAKALYNATNITCDLMIIDECSNISNFDMNALLKLVTPKLLILVGDTYQIESIKFGNWFSISQSLISPCCQFELKQTYRTKSKELLEFWNSVRNLEGKMEELCSNFSSGLNDIFYNTFDSEEVILCLHYDGLYGVNNINTLLQASNKNQGQYWGGKEYKIEDPILFNENRNLGAAIYNNIKGKIKKISLSEEQAVFTLEVDCILSELDSGDFIYLGQSASGSPLIEINVKKPNSEDDEDEYSSIVPFSVAYAMSIHKAQGLEFNSVKIVITNELENKIERNLLYTAITRAKINLRIYWSPETQKYVLDRFRSEIRGNVTNNILKNRFKTL